MQQRLLLCLATLCLGLGLFGCRAAPALPILSQVDAARESAASKEARLLAPQAYLRAEKLRQEAHEASEREDVAGAQIQGELAMVAYTHATVIARAVKAKERLANATEELEHGSRALAELDHEREELVKDAEQLELNLKVLRDATPLAPNEPALPEREQARREAARALALRARLLCVAARLLKQEATTDALLGELDRLDATLRTAPPVAPIDQVMRLNSSCLKALTALRRAPNGAPAANAHAAPHDTVGAGDRLLTELSSRSGLFPFRDDRGVVVTLRELSGSKGEISLANQDVLTTLGQVSRMHAGLPLLVVYHAGKGEPTTAHARVAEAAADLLRKGGAGSVAVQAVGGLQPLVDWKQAGASERNTRLEVVFVLR